MRFLLLLAAVLASSQAHATARFALVVGSNIGDVDDGPLRWAEQDAERIFDLLVQIGGVAKQRAALLEGPTRQTLAYELARLRGQIEEAARQGLRTEILIYYSGHGDAKSLHLGPERFTLDELHKTLDAIPTDATIVVIDACRSTTLSKGASHGPAFNITLPRSRAPRGFVQIRSAAANEVAQESDRFQGSYFTHHLVTALRGAGDSNRDGRVTLDELYRYTYNHTVATSHGETAAVQHPEMQVTLAGEGELTMTVLEHANSTLLLPTELGGNLLIVDDRTGRIVAELNKPAGVAKRLALPAGRFRVQMRESGAIYAAELPLEWGGQRTLEPTLLKKQSLRAALEKGTALDPVPFSFGVAANGGSAALLSSPSFGGRLSLERPIFTERLLVGGVLTLHHGASHGQAWTYNHQQLHLDVGLGYAIYAGPLRLALFVRAGLTGIFEVAVHRNADRLDAMGLPSESSGLRVGPHVTAEASLRLPVYGRISASIGVTATTVWIRASDDIRQQSFLQGFLGVDYAF